MSEVALTIGGKTYRVSCGEGEEAHVVRLGAMIEDKLAALKGRLAGDPAQNMLFAALLLADELKEARQVNAKTAATGAKTLPASPLPEETGKALMLAERLEQLAARIEQCAEGLERGDAKA